MIDALLLNVFFISSWLSLLLLFKENVSLNNTKETNCVSHLFITTTKYLEQLTYKKKGFIWLVVLKVSVYNQLAPLHWASGKAACHGESMWQNKTLFKKQKMRKILVSHNPLLGHTSSDLKTSHETSSLQGSTTSQLAPYSDQAFNTWAFGG